MRFVQAILVPRTAGSIPTHRRSAIARAMLGVALAASMVPGVASASHGRPYPETYLDDLQQHFAIENPANVAAPIFLNTLLEGRQRQLAPVEQQGSVTGAEVTEAPAPQPLCRDVTPSPVGTAHPGDGQADPAGRIAYAVIGRHDDAFGPIGARLYAIDPDGSDHVLLLDCDLIRPQWSPDGSRLAFTLGLDDGTWQVATIAADGSDLRVLTSGPGIHEIPAWAPDGTWLAYDSSPTGLDDPAFSTQLWRVDADGSDAALLGSTGTFDVEPRLSPDGTLVAFGRLYPDQDFASQVLVRDLTDGEERALTPLGFPVEHPEWAPDGQSLVFNAPDWAPTKQTIYTADIDANRAEPTVLLDPASGWGGVKPVYSPDGTRIAFICQELSAGDTDDGLCLMAADGTTVTVLVDDPIVAENHPAWGVASRP